MIQFFYHTVSYTNFRSTKGFILYNFLRINIRILILGYLVILYAAAFTLTSSSLLLTASDLLLTFPYLLLTAPHHLVNFIPLSSSTSINRQLLQFPHQSKLIIYTFHLQEHKTSSNIKHQHHLTGCRAVPIIPISHLLRFRS